MIHTIPSFPLTTREGLDTLEVICDLKKVFLIDMDGVIYHGSKLLPGSRNLYDGCRKQTKENSLSHQQLVLYLLEVKVNGQ